MSYQVLALKYRPQSFDEVIGQAHVTDTLKNALVKNRVAHAILFAGPRGTGKTTIARVLAKAMNCRSGPSPDPCNECPVCLDITHGHASDVFEIDGASNNSVDQIRELRENVVYKPASARYKIYIIDEVHMLSTAAFNALLKTLEEPPEHVLFMFATTEVHKIPATILSRCQRHDLSRVQFDLISSHLSALCEKEGFSILKESCDTIAIEADGSIRDALSLLDRILSITPENTITHEDVLHHLGIMDQMILMSLSKAILDADGAALIDIIDSAHDSGMDLKRFYTGIMTHLRHLAVLKLCGTKTTAVKLPETIRSQAAEQISAVSGAHLNALLQILIEEEETVRRAAHTKTAVEVSLLRLLTLNPGAQLDSIIQKLDILSRHIENKFPSCPFDGHVDGQEAKTLLQQDLSSKDPSIEDTMEKQASIPVSSITPLSRPTEQEQPESAAEPEAVTGTGGVTGERWADFLKHIETPMPFISALLSKGTLKETEGGQIVVELANCSRFDQSRLKTKKNELDAMSQSFFNKPMTVKIQAGQAPDSSRPPERVMDAKKKQAALNHPFVTKVMETFNGKIINIT